MGAASRHGLLAAGVLLLGSAGAAAPPAAGPKTYTVAIENMQFNPGQLTVHRGDRIVWANKDLFPHTATASNKAFDSGSIQAGASWTYVAAKPGDYSYGCSFHPTMKATIRVVSAAHEQ